MKRPISRLATLLLVPCLIADSATAIPRHHVSQNASAPQAIFTGQAVVQSLLIPFRSGSRSLRSHTIQKISQGYAQSPAPELQIVPRVLAKDERREILAGKENHVLLFDDLLGITDEIYPLMVGAHRSEMEQERPEHNVLAVRWDWVNKKDGSFDRAIVYIRKTGELKQVTFNTPIRPDRLQILALPISTHRAISSLYAKLGIPQVNADIDPGHSAFYNGSAAAQADSQWATWQAIHDVVATPRVVVESRGEFGPTALLLEALPAAGAGVRVRVQPDGGVESGSQSVFRITPEERNALPFDHPLAQAVERLLKAGHDAVIREEVGNVRYGSDHRRLTLRVNVVQSRYGRYDAESGYAQVGPPGSVTASWSQNGQIMTIEQALAGARYAEDPDSALPAWHARAFDKTDLEKIKDSAILALQALNRKHSRERQLYLAGIDMELEILPDGTLKTWVLDVDPRPKGLRYAHRLAQIFSEWPEAKVEPPLFSGLWAQRSGLWRILLSRAGIGLGGILNLFLIVSFWQHQIQPFVTTKTLTASA